MIVERTDFISVPVTDLERSKQFYGETLGLDKVAHREEQGFPEYQLGENVSLYLLDMKSIGSEFTAPHTASIALRVPDVEAARRELEAKGVGYVPDNQKFDIFVTYNAMVNPDPMNYSKKILTLKIRIFDSRNNNLIWQSGGYIPLGTDRQQNRMSARKLLAQLFEKYPPS